MALLNAWVLLCRQASSPILAAMANESGGSDVMLSKTAVAKRRGWGSGRIRALGEPDRVEVRNGNTVKLYALSRIEAAEALWPKPKPGPCPEPQSESASVSASNDNASPADRQNRRDREPKPSKLPATLKARMKPKRKRRRPRMSPEAEEALTESMLMQAKAGITDDELLDGTYSLAELKRRGWTGALVRDLLGEPHWLLPNPKYPNAAAPMKLWVCVHVHDFERTSAWHSRRSRASTAPTPPGPPTSDLILFPGWHPSGDTTWSLTGPCLGVGDRIDEYPRMMAVTRHERFEQNALMVIPPIAGDNSTLWNPDVYAALLERAARTDAVHVPVDDAYETCSKCGCPLAHRDDGAFGCPACGHTVTTTDLSNEHRQLEAVVVYVDGPTELLEAAAGATTEFLELHEHVWLSDASASDT